MPEVDRTRTPITLQRAAKLLPLAFRRRDHKMNAPGNELLLALLWLETAEGASMFNNNVGNLAHSLGGKRKGDYWSAPWRYLKDVEAMPDGPRKTRYLKNYHDSLRKLAPVAFRSYPTDVAGVQAFADLMLTSRYHKLMQRAHAGDVSGFAAEVKGSGYTPTGTENHPAILGRHVDSFRKARVFRGAASKGTGLGTGAWLAIGLAAVVVAMRVSNNNGD